MLSMYSSAYIQTYSSGGNLLSKTGVGNYAYSSGSHRLSNVDNTDDVIPYSSQSITYNAWGKVAEVNETIGSDTYKYELTYGPDLQRVLAVLWKNNSLVHLVTYGDGYEEKYQNGHITYYYYVDGADGNSAVYTSHTQTGDKVYCIDRDHLGSVTALFDQNGNKCFSASFDPWGRRYVEQGSIEYDRGYTGHEHIDELGLIDMNGRMYDPILGRFISVDPYIQAPYNPQNFNRYAYCLNNPVNYTDPSGELSWKTLLSAVLIAPLIPPGSGAAFVSTSLGTAGNAYVVGGIRGAIQGENFFDEATHCAVNSLKIDFGLINMDDDMCPFLNTISLTSRFTRESRQTFEGKTIAHMRNLFDNVEVEYTRGVTSVNVHSEKMSNIKWGISMGSYINSQNIKPDLSEDAMFRHEFGHTLQSLLLGPVYMNAVGVPSALGSLFSEFNDPSNNKIVNDHMKEWYETEANRFGQKFCDLFNIENNDIDRWNSRYKQNYSFSWSWLTFAPPVLGYIW